MDQLSIWMYKTPSWPIFELGTQNILRICCLLFCMRERNVQWRSSIRVRHGSTRVINGTLSDIITINITSHYFMMKYIDTPPYVKRKRKKNMTITLGHQKMWALYDITSRFIVPLRYFITFGCNLLLYEITSFRIVS